jgi:Tfp pilus assembly protein PilV
MYSHTQKGVVLVEAIVAVGVLAIIVTATLSLVTRSAAGLRNANDHLVATYLLQDVVETVYARYEYNKNTEPLLWQTGLTCPTTPTCILETNTPNILNISLQSADCSTGACDLWYNSGLFTYVGGGGASATSYTRWVEVTTLSGGDELQIEVTVSWPSGPHTETLSTSLNLYAPA